MADDPMFELERTRTGVVNTLIAAAAGVAVSGYVLRGREILEAPPGGTLRAHRLAMLVLLGLVAVSYATLRADRSGRGRLRVIAAAVGALAVPLGLAHGWWVDPAPAALAPFWVAALGLGALAFPRGNAVAGAEFGDDRETR